jgi:hypothetical protein
MKIGQLLRRNLFNSPTLAKDNWKSIRNRTFWTEENLSLWDYPNAEINFPM